MAGSLPVRAYAANSSTLPGVSLQTMAEKEKGKRMPARVKTPVKARVAARSGDQGCKGKNTCKGKGGCASKGH